MSMKQNVILTTVTRAMVPLILLFGLYVQVHGEQSPGGGFQAGVILASAFILYALVFGLPQLLLAFPTSWQKAGACMGVIIYAGVGFICLGLGGNFLDYHMLAPGTKGQAFGIFLVEIGVGLTVCSTMVLLFSTFAARKK